MVFPDPVSETAAVEFAKHAAAWVWRALKRCLAWIFRRGRTEQPAPAAPAAPAISIEQHNRASRDGQVIAPIIGDVNLGTEPKGKEPMQ
jgi:hypothetical protein